MLIKIDEQYKIAGIWITREENENPETKQKIQSLLLQYKKKKYIPVVYISGTKDFVKQTAMLLSYNKNLQITQ